MGGTDDMPVVCSVGDDNGEGGAAAVDATTSSLRLSVPALESRDRTDHLRSRLNRPWSDRPRLLPEAEESEELLLSCDGTQLGRGNTDP